jgi:uncharacterized protein with PIN domain
MRFIVTKELGRLARWLRIAGFDTVYYQDVGIGRLAILALRDGRVIVTRNRHIPHLQQCTVVIHATELIEQLREMKNKLDLAVQADTMFTRCTCCNTLLEACPREIACGKVPAHVFSHVASFTRCPSCSKIYWQGSHWGNVREVLTRL